MPVVVRASTRATVYAFFSTAAAAAATTSSGMGAPRKKAMAEMFLAMRSTVSWRCASLSAHSSAATVIALAGAALPACGLWGIWAWAWERDGNARSAALAPLITAAASGEAQRRHRHRAVSPQLYELMRRC